MSPSLSGPDGYGVALVGEALGQEEAIYGYPFVGKAGHKLTRLIEWAGLERNKFDIWNVVWTRPPDNQLEGMPYEAESIRHGRDHHWGELLHRAKVVVPMGNVALNAFTGRKGILSIRGYVQHGNWGPIILPTVHPSFIQRGQSKYSAPFIHDIQKAVELARGGLPPQSFDYLLDPSPQRAYEWALSYRERLEADPTIRLAYDIETPGKAEDEGELKEEDDPTYTIYRIGFAYKAYGALSVPWTPPYLAAIRLLLESEGEKVVWNASFDNPRIAFNGVHIAGLVHDGMVAWHVLHSDLPKGLGFVATFTCPWQQAWKHLSHAAPAFYNATDADVELRSMEVIEAELRRTGLWEVYDRDVLQIEPILVHMSREGMPIDQSIRADRAVRLAEEQERVLGVLESLVPLEARPIDHVFVDTPKLLDGLLSRPSSRRRRLCLNCGRSEPFGDHFKRVYLPRSTGEPRIPNPCRGAGVEERDVEVTEYYRLKPFKPSRLQLIAYNKALSRPIPRKRDKKTKTFKFSFDEKAIKDMIRKYPDDKLYPGVLDYRSLDKLAGTYIGRPVKGDSK